MALPSSELWLSDGRCLEFTVAGPDDGALLVSHHGTRDLICAGKEHA